MNNFMDALSPTTIQPSGARKVLQMTKRDDAEDKRRNEEMQRVMDLDRFLKAKVKQEERDRNLEKQIWKSRHRRLKETVERARGKLNQAQQALEEFLNA